MDELPKTPTDHTGTIFVIPYTHADVAWIHTRAWHIDRYTRDLDEVLDMLDADPDYRYYIDTWTELMKPYVRLRPERLETLRRHVREGRLAVCCGHYGNVRTTMVGNETLVRNLQLGRRRWEELVPGVRLNVFADQDVCIGHSQLPQLLALGGISGYCVQRPLEGLDQQGVPRAFLWQGLSGDRVLVSRAYYGSLFWPSDRKGERWDTDWEAAVAGEWQELLARAAQEPVRHLPLFVGSDDTRPDRFLWGDDRRCNYGQFIALWNQRLPSHMRYGTPDELIDGLLGDSAQLPVVEGVLDPAETNYNIAPHGRAGIWWQREHVDRLLVDAEILSSLAALTRGAAYPEAALTEAWETLLDWMPHAVQWLFRQDWVEGKRALTQAARTAEDLANAALAALVDECLPLDAAALAVVNPLPGPRREVMPLWLVNSDLTRDIARIVDAEAREAPFQIVDRPVVNCEYDLLVDVASPGCGVTGLRVEWQPVPDDPDIYVRPGGSHARTAWKERYGYFDPRPVDGGDLQLESDRLRVRLAEGHVVEVTDLQSSVRRCAPQGASFLEPLYFPAEMQGWYTASIPDNPERFVVEETRWDEAGPLRWRVTRTGRAGPFWVRQHLDLVKGEAAVRATTQFLDPADLTACLMAVGLPLALGAGLTVDIPFGTEPRDLAAVRYGAGERAIGGVFWGRTWANSRDALGDLALLAEDGDRMFRAWGDPARLLHFLALKTPIYDTSWEHYIDTFDLSGPQIFRHRMVLGESQTPDLVQVAERLRHPLQARWAREMPAPAAPLLALSPETVCLSALTVDEGRLFMRVVQMANEPAEVEVALPASLRAAELVDFQGATLPGMVECEGTALRFPINPWQIATIRGELCAG